MNLPNIPTDNLYKFLAIAGLLLFISSFAIYFIFGNTVIGNGQSYLQNAALIKFDQQTIDRDIDFNQKRLNDLEKTLTPAETQFEKQKTLNDIASSQNNIKNDKQKQNDIEREVILFNNGFNIEWFRTEVMCMIWMLYIGTIVGLIMSLLGFIFWYLKLQRYQDRLIKQKAEGK